MKKSIFLLLLIFGFTFISSAQEPPSGDNLRQAISLKPTNFSNIDLGKSGESQGYHIGIAYERLFRPNSHWSWVLPITFGGYFMHIMVTDYEKHGTTWYSTPGVKYYLKAGNPRKGWSASANLLVGTDNYNHSGYHSRRGHVDKFFYGLLGSWILNAPISKTAAFNFELGFGLRNTHYQSVYTDPDDYPNNHTQYSIDEWRLSGIMNFSVGISKWF